MNGGPLAAMPFPASHPNSSGKASSTASEMLSMVTIIRIPA
jgi:hypothetical protein